MIGRRAFLGAGAALTAALALDVVPGAARWVPAAGPDGAPRNPYLAGNFAAVDAEVEASGLAVTGALPPELEGWFLRVGPNPIDPDPGSYHWFMGDGMVHAVELRGGRAASYRNRWVRTDAAAALLGEPPVPGQPAESNPVPNAANTALVLHAGHLLALYETSLPTELTPQLETRDRYDFGGAMRSPMTAHPKLDPGRASSCSSASTSSGRRTCASTSSTPPADSCGRLRSTSRRRR